MTPKEFEILLSDAEVQLSRIKHLYEQWFQGIERLEPQIARKQFERTMHELRKVKPRNTALRFRYNTLIQRYTTLQTYWRRVGRQIEEGTYRRDLLRARRRREAMRTEREEARRHRSSSPVELDPEQEVDVDSLISEASEHLAALKSPAHTAESRGLDLDDSGIAAPQASRSEGTPASHPPSAFFRRPQSRSPGASRERPGAAIHPGRKDPPPIASRSKGPGDVRMRQIYDSYVEAKRQNNERTDKIDYETVAKSLKKMVPKLDRKHRGKQIDFQVVVKDGKVGIKPVVKK
ncbi:MAG: MXAN_5187 C-terminal domain-containing protein [Polyangiales bacterium]